MAFPGGRLSVGSVKQIYSVPDYNLPAVLQVMEVKKMAPSKPAANLSERFRLALSDSDHFIPAMLTTGLNEMVYSGKIQNLGVVRITDYICNPLPGKIPNSKIVVILALEVVSGPLDAMLGSPADVSGASQTFNGAVPQGAAAPASGGHMPMAPAAAAAPRMAQPLIDPSTGQALTPIKELDRYLTRWTIRARCSQKSEERKYGNGNGVLFSVTLVDETGEIRATMFNEAVARFSPIFREGDMYLISGGSLKFANKKFTSVKHAYELTLNADATVQPIEDAGTVPRVHLDFMPIDNIQSSKKDEMIDIIGVVVSTQPVSTIATKNGDKAKRSIEIGDNSGRTIELTLWEKQVSEFDDIFQQYGEHPVVAMKAVRVSDFGGWSLSTTNGTVILPEPDVPNNPVVRQWFNAVQSGSQQVASLTERRGGGGMGGGGGSGREKTLSAIVNEGLGTQQTPDWINVPNIYVTRFKRDNPAAMGGDAKPVTLWYKACSNEACNGTKVIEAGPDNFQCPKCSSVNSYRLRWVTNCTGFDHTGKQFLSGFGDAGKVLLGCEAEYVAELKDRVDDYNFARVFEEMSYKTYTMRLSVKQDHWNESVRTKVSISSVTPIDFVEDSKRLLLRIDELSKR
jgi:replication factor A1